MKLLKAALVCSWRGHDPRTEAWLWEGRSVPVPPYCVRCLADLAPEPLVEMAHESGCSCGLCGVVNVLASDDDRTAR